MPLFAFFVADLVEEKPCQEANMDTQESVAIENTTDADDVAVFGASTSTSTAPIPSASTPKRIGTVSTVITRYFAPVAKPTLPAARPGAGRPRKRGRRSVIVPSLPPIVIADGGTCPQLLLPKIVADDPPPPHKKTRINWGKPGPFRDLMKEAIQNWFGLGEDRFDDNGEIINDHAIYAHRVGIPPKTFYKYIHPDETKRLVLGDGSRGKAKLLTDNDVKFAGEVLARQDRTNDGLS